MNTVTKYAKRQMFKLDLYTRGHYANRLFAVFAALSFALQADAWWRMVEGAIGGATGLVLGASAACMVPMLILAVRSGGLVGPAGRTTMWLNGFAAQLSEDRRAVTGMEYGIIAGVVGVFLTHAFVRFGHHLEATFRLLEHRL